VCVSAERHLTRDKAGSGVHTPTQDVRQISLAIVIILLPAMPSLHLRKRLLHALRLVSVVEDVIIHLAVEECLARDGLSESAIVWPL
jgi:hypothetical protein